MPPKIKWRPARSAQSLVAQGESEMLEFKRSTNEIRCRKSEAMG